MNSNQDHQNEVEQNLNRMTDIEKIDESNIIYQEMKKIKFMEQFGLGEGNNKLLVEAIKQTQETVREMVQLQYENCEAHIPYSKEKAPNQQLLELREKEQFLKERHRESFDRLGKAIQNFHIALEKKCKPKTEQIKTTLDNLVKIDVNELMDSGLTYQETLGALFMEELEKNKADNDKYSEQFSYMAKIYRDMGKEVKQRQQTVDELIEVRKTLDKAQQLL